MTETEQELDKKIGYWALLGPSVVLMTLLFTISKPGATSFAFAIVAFLGVFASWLWQSRGLWIGLAAIVVYLFSMLGDLPAKERFWQLSSALSLVFGFVITAFSSEDLSACLRRLRRSVIEMGQKQAEKDSMFLSARERMRQECLFFEEQCKALKEECERSRAHLQKSQGALSTLQKDWERLTWERGEMHKSAALFQIDLQQAQTALEDERRRSAEDKRASKLGVEALERHMMVLKEESSKKLEEAYRLLHEAQHQERESSESLKRKCAEWERLRENSAALEESLGQLRQQLESAHAEKMAVAVRLEQTTQEMAGKDEAVHALRAELQTLSQQMRQAAAEKEAWAASEAAFASDRERHMARIAELDRMLAAAEAARAADRQLEAARLEEVAGTLTVKQAEIDRLLALKLSLAEPVAPAEPQALPEELDKEIRRLKSQEALLKQLRRQFDEKNDVLHETRVQVFQLEGLLFALQKEAEELRLDDDAPYHGLLTQLHELDEERALWQQEALALQQLVSSLVQQPQETNSLAG